MCDAPVVSMQLLTHFLNKEFRAWLIEECMLNLEAMSKDQTKKQFAKYIVLLIWSNAMVTYTLFSCITDSSRISTQVSY